MCDDVHAYGSKIIASISPMLPRGKSYGGVSPKFMQQAEGFFPIPPSELATVEEIKTAIAEAVQEAKKMQSFGFDGIALGMMGGLAAANNIRTDESVSYTHLDVYKRQHLHHGGQDQLRVQDSGRL